MIATLLAFSACNSPGRYDRNQKAGEQWLAQHTETATINLTGGWNVPDWGKADIVQGGNRINGQLDKYTIYGRASGNKAYLLISEGGWTYYTAIVSMEGKGVLMGYYSKSVPFDSSKQQLIRFIATQ